ncbi:MAG: hypothetical protein J2P45_21205 [Candidatus Dormibacteraeota bacterium]|nr:hypothetical protein [Candidatus Dormibacteraeota bacterium]
MPAAAIVLIGGASIALVVGVLALTARRLLGLQVGLARAVLAGAVGFLAWSRFDYLQGAGSVHLPGAQGGSVLARGLTLFQVIGYYLLVVGGLLMLRVLLVAFRPSR